MTFLTVYTLFMLMKSIMFLSLMAFGAWLLIEMQVFHQKELENAHQNKEVICWLGSSLIKLSPSSKNRHWAYLDPQHQSHASPARMNHDKTASSARVRPHSFGASGREIWNIGLSSSSFWVTWSSVRISRLPWVPTAAAALPDGWPPWWVRGKRTKRSVEMSTQQVSDEWPRNALCFSHSTMAVSKSMAASGRPWSQGCRGVLWQLKFTQ